VAPSKSSSDGGAKQQQCAASGERARSASRAEQARRRRGMLGKEGGRADKDGESGGLGRVRPMRTDALEVALSFL
jgi:hypothetical protein